MQTAFIFAVLTVNAKPEKVFRWLCQLRVAPYSYDLIDNFGRRSPQQLKPGSEQLALGQPVMTIFELVDFRQNNHITGRIWPGSKAEKIFGAIAGSYCVKPLGNGKTCLLVKIQVKYPRRWWGSCMRAILPVGDLIMMRKQLLNFKRLVEKEMNY